MDSSNTESCGTAACESLASQPLVGSARPATDTVFHIEKMDCPSEELQIRQRVGQIAGVEALGFDLQQHRLTVTHRLDDLSPVPISNEQPDGIVRGSLQFDGERFIEHRGSVEPDNYPKP